jgi:hypothetical protein
MTSHSAIDDTKRWIAETVIRLNLCPFAKRVFDAGLIRYRVAETAEPSELLDVLAEELRRLAKTPREEIETTILIHPHCLTAFLDYNDFLADADRLLKRTRLAGVIQIASFHPQYQFQGTEPDAPENRTNRSPHPMLHLLREVSITEVAKDPAVLLGIPERNIELMRRLFSGNVMGQPDNHEPDRQVGGEHGQERGHHGQQIPPEEPHQDRQRDSD